MGSEPVRAVGRSGRWRSMAALITPVYGQLGLGTSGDLYWRHGAPVTGRNRLLGRSKGSVAVEYPISSIAGRAAEQCVVVAWPAGAQCGVGRRWTPGVEWSPWRCDWTAVGVVRHRRRLAVECDRAA